MDRMNPIHRLLADHGLRATRQRTAIFRTLCATDTHPSADELFERVKPVCPGMSRATVYNNLEALADAGLVRVLPPPIGKGASRFDATTDQHIHVRDEATGQVADVPDDLSDKVLTSLPADLVREIEQRMAFRCDRIHIELQGRFERTGRAVMN